MSKRAVTERVYQKLKRDPSRTTYLCELRFDEPDDPQDPHFSFLEVDAYVRVPSPNFEDQHRLTLRKNLGTGKFEVLKCYWGGRREVVFAGSFEDALCAINAECERWWGPDFGDLYAPCSHRDPERDGYCPLKRRR